MLILMWMDVDVDARMSVRVYVDIVGVVRDC